jgi:hypothetical protein
MSKSLMISTAAAQPAGQPFVVLVFTGDLGKVAVTLEQTDGPTPLAPRDIQPSSQGSARFTVTIDAPGWAILQAKAEGYESDTKTVRIYR